MLVFSAKLHDASFGNAKGGRTNPPPPPVRPKVAKHRIRARVNPRPAGGPKGPPCGFSQIAPEVLGISLWNLSYLSGQQFHTLRKKLGPRS